MKKILFILSILIVAVSVKAQTAYPLAGNDRDTGLFKGSVRIEKRIKAPYFKAASGDTMVICADAAGNFFAISIDQVRTGEPGGGGGTTYFPGYAIKIEGDSIKLDTTVAKTYFVRVQDSTFKFVTPFQLATGNYTKTEVNSLLAGKSDIGHTHSQYIGKTENFGAVNPRVNADSNSFTFGDATFSQPYGVNIYGGLYAALNFKSDLNFIGMTPRSSTPTADGTNLGTWQVNKMTNSGLNSAGSINFIAAGGSSTRFSYIDILTANNRSAFIGREGIRGHSFTSGSIGMVSIASSSENGLFYANPQAGYSYPLYHGIKSVGSSQPLLKLDRDNGQVLSLIDKDGILTTTSYIFKNDTVITSNFTVSDSNNYIYVNTSDGNVSVSFSSTLKKEHVWYIKKISSDNNTVNITSPDASIDGNGNISFADKRSIRIHHKDSLNFETNNLIAEQDVDHVHGTDFGMISDLVYGQFNSTANSDTITATTSLFHSGDEGKIIFVAGIRNSDGFYNDTTFGLTSVITHYVSPTRVVIADTADYTRTNKIGYFGTENTDKYYAAVKYAADHNIAGVEANGTGGYLFAPQFSSLKDSACFPIRHDVILKAYPGINFFKLCIEDNMHVDSSKDYAYTFFKMFGTVNIIYDGLTLVAPHNYDDYKTGGVRAFTYKNAGSQSNGQVIFKDVKVIGDTNSHYPNYDIQWANFYENSARVGTNGGTHSTYIYNCVAQTRVGAISMFDDTTGKSLYIDGFTTYNGGSREMARPVGAHAQMNSGSHILDITGITGYSFYPDNTQYTDYNRNYAVKIVYGTDTFTSVIDSIVDANTAYLHDAAPANIVNGTYYSYSAGGNLEGENFYIDNTVDIVMKNVRQINPYKWGLHIYTTDTKPDAKIRDYINFETIRDGMLYGIQGNGDIVGRHGTPIINLTHCKMEYSPFNQPLKINARDCYFPRQALFYAKSTITNSTFEKEAYGNAFGDTVTFNNCIALSYVTGAGCYNKVIGGVSKYFNNDTRTSYINTVDSNGHQFNNKLRAGSSTDRVRLITTQGEEKWIAADTFTQAVKRTFRKTGTDSVFAVSIKGDTTFQFIDSIGAGGGSGEANTASNLGGGVGLFSTKNGVDLRFNSLNSNQFFVASNLISLDTSKFHTIGYYDGRYAPTGSYLTSESDPIFTAHYAHGLSSASAVVAAFTSAGTTDDVPEGATNLYWTTAKFNAAFSGKTTDNLTEGSTNLYYTATRFNTAFSGKSTTDLTEGSNLYWTNSRFDTRFDSRLSAKTTDDLTEGTTNLYWTNTRFDTRFSGKSTTNLSEGSNLYYTDARARAALSLTTTGSSGAATYNSTTGVLNIPQYTGGGSGTVTSVDMTVPSWLSVSGNPVTTSGTLAVTAAGSQTANRFVATPDGSTGAVSLRAIATGDLPTVIVSKGGTGLTSTTAYGLLAGGTTSTGNFQNIGTGTAGQFLMSNGNAALASFVSLGAANNTIVSGNAVNVAATETQIGGDIVITPSSSSAKIKITAYVSMVKDAGTTVRTGSFRVKNATGTPAQVGKDIVTTSAGVASNPFGATLSVIDAPGSTSAQTYRFYGQMSSACSTSVYYAYAEELTPAGQTGATGATGATGPAQGISVNTQSGTTYTLQASDNGKVVEFTSNSAVTCTLPSGLGTTFGCTITQSGTGQVTLSASGTTIQNRNSYTKTAGQYASFVILPTGTSNTYRTQGDMQ